MRSRSCYKNREELHLVFLLAFPRTQVIFQEPPMLSESTLQMQISFNHPVIISSFPYLPKLFSLENPQEPTLCRSLSLSPSVITGNKKRGGWVYSHWIVLVRARLLWHWKQWAYGTPSPAMQYSERCYIIHPSFFLCFWRAILKVSQFDNFNLIWQACEAASAKNLDGLALQLLTGRVDIGMIMRHTLFSKEWMN